MEEIIINLVRKPITFWINWIVFALVFVCIAKFFSNKKPKKLDVKTRNWKRFIYTNFELLQHLNEDEKMEMLKVFDTTVQNAELFSKQSVKLSPKRDQQKVKGKKVTFVL